jgi:membrane-associated phospholipid phosphatase
MDTILPLHFRLQILTLTLLGWIGIYFFINRLQVEPNRRLDLATPLDGKIPFVPQLALVYFSTYIFVIQPFIILTEARQFYWMLVSFGTITVIASLIHAIVPSKIERNEILLDADGFSGKLINLFQKTCKPYGNFPSMHVALSVPVVGANFMVLGPTAGSITLVWAILIALSTLYTKQHYILDVLAGLIGGVLIYSVTYLLMMG